MTPKLPLYNYLRPRSVTQDRSWQRMKKQDILIRALPITPSGGGCHLRIQSGIVLKVVAYRWRGGKLTAEMLLKNASLLLQSLLEPETKSQIKNKTNKQQTKKSNLLSVVKFSSNEGSFLFLVSASWTSYGLCKGKT